MTTQRILYPRISVGLLAEDEVSIQATEMGQGVLPVKAPSLVIT